MSKPLQIDIERTDDIQYVKDQLGFGIDAFLRMRGWKHTCETPGSFWLWEREHKGRTLLVNRETAISLETYISGDYMDDAEQPNADLAKPEQR